MNKSCIHHAHLKSQIWAQRKHPRPFIRKWACVKKGQSVSAIANLNNTTNSAYMLLDVYIRLYLNIINILFAFLLLLCLSPIFAWELAMQGLAFLSLILFTILTALEMTSICPYIFVISILALICQPMVFAKLSLSLKSSLAWRLS